MYSNTETIPSGTSLVPRTHTMHTGMKSVQENCSSCQYSGYNAIYTQCISNFMSASYVSILHDTEHNYLTKHDMSVYD